MKLILRRIPVILLPFLLVAPEAKGQPSQNLSDHQPHDRSYYRRDGPVAITPWPQGRVPYEVNAAKVDEADLQKHLNKIMQLVPCVKFVKRNSERAYVRFDNERGCKAHAFGKSSLYARHKVELCPRGQHGGRHGLTYHETLHALGAMHEMIRPDRDDFVTTSKYTKLGWGDVNYGPICHGAMVDRAACLAHVLKEVVPFDVDSVMIYPPCPGKTLPCSNPSMTRKDDPANQLFGAGNDKLPDLQLSAGDVSKMKYIYGCNADVNRQYDYAMNGCKSFTLSFKANSWTAGMYGQHFAGEYKMSGKFMGYDKGARRPQMPVYVHTGDTKKFMSAIKSDVRTSWQWMIGYGGAEKYGGQRGFMGFKRSSGGLETMAWDYKLSKWVPHSTIAGQIIFTCNDAANQRDLPPSIF